MVDVVFTGFAPLLTAPAACDSNLLSALCPRAWGRNPLIPQQTLYLPRGAVQRRGRFSLWPPQPIDQDPSHHLAASCCIRRSTTRGYFPHANPHRFANSVQRLVLLLSLGVLSKLSERRGIHINSYRRSVLRSFCRPILCLSLALITKSS